MNIDVTVASCCLKAGFHWAALRLNAVVVAKSNVFWLNLQLIEKTISISYNSFKMSYRSNGAVATFAPNSVLIKIAFVCSFLLTLFVLMGQSGTVHAVTTINTPRDPNNPYITGLWSTGLTNPIPNPNPALPPSPPQLLPIPAPGNFNQTNPYYLVPNEIHEDPHWRLTQIRNANPGPPNHCQVMAGPRQAVTIHPPHAVAGDNWVWWRNIPTPGARWVGARPNAYHDNYLPGTFNYFGNPCEVLTTFVYELVGGFNVGACVDTNNVKLKFRWGADDFFKMILNPGTPQEFNIVANPNGTPVLGPSGYFASEAEFVGQNKLRSNDNNTLRVEVTSAIQLTAFVIMFEEPEVICNQPRPYLKVFGNDVAAGGMFTGGNTCNLTNLPNRRATILAHHKGVQATLPTVVQPDNWTGSSSQLAAFALGQIQGFFTAGNHSPRVNTNASVPVNGLTFGNYGDPTIATAGNWDTTGNILDPNRVIADGGKGGQYRCITDYFTTVSQKIGGGTPNPANSVNLSSTAAAHYKPGGGKITINNSTNVTGKHAIVVDGDVYIGPQGITYGGYTSAANMPSVYIIAKGNIYIDRSVRDIQGVFIAQPLADGSKGVIYTCSNSSGAIVANDLREYCNQSLTVTGAFIAQMVKFLRVNGNLDNSVANETWPSGAGNNIAEVFKSSGELYLSAPDQLRKTTSDKSKYDSVTSLPPVL